MSHDDTLSYGGFRINDAPTIVDGLAFLVMEHICNCEAGGRREGYSLDGSAVHTDPYS